MLKEGKLIGERTSVHCPPKALRHICHRSVSGGLLSKETSKGALETIVAALCVCKEAVASSMGRSGLKGYFFSENAWKRAEKIAVHHRSTIKRFVSGL